MSPRPVQQSLKAAHKGASAVNAKLIDMAQETMNSGLEHARDLAGVKNPMQALKLQMKLLARDDRELHGASAGLARRSPPSSSPPPRSRSARISAALKQRSGSANKDAALTGRESAQQDCWGRSDDRSRCSTRLADRSHLRRGRWEFADTSSLAEEWIACAGMIRAHAAISGKERSPPAKVYYAWPGESLQP